MDQSTDRTQQPRELTALKWGLFCVGIPALLLAFVLAEGSVLFVVPKFAEMFDEMLEGVPLPGLTTLVLAWRMGFAMLNPVFVLAGIGVGTVGLLPGRAVLLVVPLILAVGFVFEWLAIAVALYLPLIKLVEALG